jgi:Na+(H+)/acetate symporter ActP
VIPLLAVLLVVLATIFIGAYGVRLARTTSDVLVASRTVPPMWNASAISGEYLSAASFLGVAGLILKYGADMLWYPVGYAAGYLILLLFVAAPLRRSGAYTIPDFAEGRFDSARLRRVATGFVLLIGWFYLLPQMKGAGVTLSVLVGTPYWVGVIVVGSVITANVALGGMRGITFVQAFQYWVKVTAIALPAMVILGHFQADGRPELTRPDLPTFTTATDVEFHVDTTFVVAADVVVDADGTVDGDSVHGPLTLEPGEHTAVEDTLMVFPAGSLTPHAVGIPASGGDSWGFPSGPIGDDRSHPLFFTYSLLLATFLGTMGLPHILVRFYTNPDGRAARQTTVIVLVLMAAFYVFPPVYGFLGRYYTPDLYLTGRTDAVVLVLPGRIVGGLAGELLTGLVAAGAFAAFMSTSSGLLISVAGALAHDVLRGGVRQFRAATVAAGIVAMVLGLGVSRFDINMLVGWAFAIAASSFCPLLVLGIWWRRLTPTGALVGILAGGSLASLAILATMADLVDGGWPEALLSQPAAWSVPIAFLTMIVVSRLTTSSPEVDEKQLAMHLPERLTAGRTARPSAAAVRPSVDTL